MVIFAGVVLAGHDRETHAHVRVVRRRGFSAASAALSSASARFVGEPIEVDRARVEAVDACLHAVIELGFGDERSARAAVERHQHAECFVERDFQTELEILAGALSVDDARRPEHDALRPRIAGRDRIVERRAQGRSFAVEASEPHATGPNMAPAEITVSSRNRRRGKGWHRRIVYSARGIARVTGRGLPEAAKNGPA